MPEFPRYNSSGQMTTQKPQPDAPQDAEGAIQGQLAKTFQSAQESVVKWAESMDTIQSTVFKANAEAGIQDVLARYEADPKYNDISKYKEELSKLKSEVVTGFTTPRAGKQASFEYDHAARLANIKLDGIFKKKSIDAGQAASMRILDGISNTPTLDYKERITAELDTQINAGIFDRKDAYELERTQVKKAKKNMFIGDIASSPSLAEERLSKNEYEFDVREMSDAKGILENETNKIQMAQKNDLLTAYLNGEDISPIAVKKLMNEKKIDPTFASSLLEKIENPKPDKLSRDVAFIELQNKGTELLAKGNKATAGDISKYMTEIMQNHVAGILDKDDVDRMIKNFNPIMQDKFEKVAEEVLSKSNPKTFMQKITFWSDEYATKKPEIKARMYRKMLDSMIAGKKPDKALAQIIDDELNIQLADNVAKPDRQFATNPETNQRIYSDDGAIWFDEKTGKEIK